MLLDKKLLEILAHPADGALTIVTQGADGPHIANTWNSYVLITDDGRLLIPAGGMKGTEENIQQDNRAQLAIASREVEGMRYKGAGFLVSGTASFQFTGSDFEKIQAKFPWARGALVIEISTTKQTL